MKRKPLVSSNIRSIGYEQSTLTLEIEFHSGGIYQYYSVPLNVYEALMKASSHGKYFHAHIKGKYGDTKIGKAGM